MSAIALIEHNLNNAIVQHSLPLTHIQSRVGVEDPADVGNLISGSSAFSKTILNIRKFMVHVLPKPGLENVEHYFTSM